MDTQKSCVDKQCEELEEINQTCGSFIQWKSNPLQLIQSKQCKYPLKFIISISLKDPATQTPGEVDLHCIILQSYPTSSPTIKIAFRFHTQIGDFNSNAQSTKSGFSMLISPTARKHLADDMMDEIRNSNTDKTIFAAINYLRGCDLGLTIAKWFPKPSINSNSTSSLISQRWFFSHHFISQLKRHMLMQYTQELEITGFLIGGIPGYLYIEGNEDNQQAFINRLKSFNWQSLDEISLQTTTSRICSEMVEFEGEPNLIQETLKKSGLDITFNKLFDTS